MSRHRKKQDCQARRLNFDDLSDEEDVPQQAADNVVDLCTLNDTNDASLLDALLPFEPLEGFTLNELACPPPSPASSEEPTILYGEGLLQ